MKFQAKQNQPLPQLQMTAMMDIIFLLLCFFITSSIFSQWEYEVNLTLPVSETGEMPIRLSGEIIINVSKSGLVTINSQRLDDEALATILDRVAQYMPNQPIIIRADKATDYGSFMHVIDACRKAGISNISLATREDDVVEGTSL